MDKRRLLISEEEISKLFAPPRPKRTISSYLRRILKELIIAGAIFIILFALVNWPAISSHVGYWWHLLVQNQPANEVRQDQPSPANNSIIKSAPTNEPRLLIPKIGIEAPIIWDIPYKEIHENLKNGVVHYAGTALPGETGNTFITGHSSDYVWSPGNYKDVFALLDKLAPGDSITVWYQGKVYEYEVTEHTIVKPTETSVLNPTEDPILTLMTCYPVGTTKNRLIVRAKLTSPQSTEDKVESKSPQIFTLPEHR